MAGTLKNFTEKLFSAPTELPVPLQLAHLPSLDGLRGISIIMVLVYHMLLAYNITCFNGMFGVNIFFVISGFIITTLLLREKFRNGDVSLGKFYARRFLKIIPVAYCYLLVVVVVNSYYKIITLPDILAAALFIKNTDIIPTHWDVATGHFWSLSVEEQFYIVFPFLLKRSTNGYLVVLVLLIIFIPVFLTIEGRAAAQSGSSGMSVLADLLRYITPILTGALCAVLLFKKIISGRLYPNNLVVNLFILFVAYEIYCGAGFLGALYYKNFICSALVAAVIANNIIPSADLFFRLLNSKILVTIGLASYSIYVWQQLFLMAHPWGSIGGVAVSGWIELAAVLAVSFFSYYVVERRLAKIKSRFR